MNNGFTVEPQIAIDPATGEEVLNYDHAVITDHSIKEQVNRQHQIEQKYAITEDQEGNLSHAWDVENPEVYEEQQIEEEPDEEEVFDFESDIFGQLGGQQNYDRLLDFAANNWTDQDIQAYDKTMDSGDLETIYKAVNFLLNDYREAMEERQQRKSYWG